MADRQAARKARTAARTADAGLRSLPGHLSEDGGNGKFDRLVHERIRLGMLSALAVNKSLSFSELKSLLKTSDGNLSVHARKLEDAGYIACSKSFQGRLPKTEYHITAKGRRAFGRYLDHMEALIRSMRRTQE